MSEDRSQLLSWALARIAEGERLQDEMREDWDRYFDVYMAKKVSGEDIEDSMRSSLRVPHIHQMVDTIMPRLTVPDPEFDLSPQQPTDENVVSIIKDMMRHDMEQDNYARKQNDWNESSLVYGWGVVKVTWAHEKYRKKVFRRLNPIERLRGLDPVEEVEIVKTDRPTVKPLQIKDFLRDPGATSMEDAEWCAEISWLGKNQIKALVDMGVLDNWEEFDQAASATVSDDDRGPQGGGVHEGELRDNEEPEERMVRRGNKFEVIEIWTKDRRVITIVGRRVVMRNDENPYLHGEMPFAVFTPWPKMFSFEGMSIPEISEDIQDQIHTLENQRIEAGKLALDPPWLVKRNVKGGRDIQWGPGARILIDNFDAVKQLDTKPNLNIGWDEVQAYLGYMQQVVGVNPYIAGIDGSQQNVDQSTATGISVLVEGAEKRIGQFVLNQNYGVQRIGQLMVSMYQQFVSEKRMRKLVSDQGDVRFLEISPEDIAGEFDVRVRGSGESINRELRRAGAIEMINALAPAQGTTLADGSVIDLKPAYEHLINSFNLAGSERFFVPQEEVQAAPPPPQQGPPGGLL